MEVFEFYIIQNLATTRSNFKHFIQIQVLPLFMTLFMTFEYPQVYSEYFDQVEILCLIV